MKKRLLSVLGIGCLIFSGVDANLFAQAKQYAFFEHFTQASCGPCASQNPSFQDNILGQFPDDVRHVAYHTSWPGVDPMYSENPKQIDSITAYYQPSGVPKIYTMGATIPSGESPTGISTSDVNNIISGTSPIKIDVSQVDNGNTRDVTVTVNTVGTPPSGDHYLRTLVVEREITYPSAPGSNGEKYFPNVFRKFLPHVKAITFTLPSTGNSVTHHFTFNEDSDWDMSQIEVLAYVINKTTKLVVNCGATFDLDPAGIEKKETLEIGKTYPNPANDQVMISLNHVNENMYVELIDVTGRLVATKNVEKGSKLINIDTSTLPSGIYNYRLKSENGLISPAKRLVIRH